MHSAPTHLFRTLFLAGLMISLSACSMGQIIVRTSQPILNGGVEAMNRETDLALAREAIPANIKMMEGMLIRDPDNLALQLLVAQGFYGYAYGFIEDEDRERAATFYRRCYEHGRKALTLAGITPNPETSTPAEFTASVNQATGKAVPAMFWTASCLGKWIDLNRTNVAGIAELASAATLMKRVLELDETFYFGGAHMFFGVYYGGRSPMFGGDFERAEHHFARANEINNNKLLLPDLLHAEYFDRQRLDKAGFETHLQRIIDAPDNLYPEMALVNNIARVKARRLLQYKDSWF
jgi:hypothetical protein